MELECKRSDFDAWEIGGEVTLTQEETAETIVPDYCPDIARIITTEGKVFLHNRELREGKGEVSGTVRVSVLYTPDGESGIRTLEFSMPFTAETDGRGLGECTVLFAEAEPELLEARTLNPRKVFTHCKLVLRLTGYRRMPLRLCTDVEAGPEWCIEKRQEKQQSIVTTHVVEKDFTFAESVNLSPGKEGAAELLCSRVAGAVTETKLVGNKLILKGLFSLSLLYRTAAGESCAADCELPFSQIMEVEGAAEGSTAAVQLQFTGCDIQIDSGDPEGRQLAVTLYCHALAQVQEERELTLLADLYSTAYDVSYEAAPVQLAAFSEHLVRRQTVREVLETGVVAASVLSVAVTCGTVSVSWEGSYTVLRTGANVRALYLDEGGASLMAERCLEVSCQLELPQDCRARARAVCGEQVQCSLGDRGIEVRFPVDFHMDAVSKVRRACITSAKVADDSPKDLSGAPSLVLRCLGRQETAWELAKQYNTTIATILTANELEAEEDIPRDQLLLIPRKRA